MWEPFQAAKNIMIEPASLSQLEAITHQVKFQTIPNQLVPADTRWYDMPGEISQVGLDTFTWEMAHTIAQVLDAYGDKIEQVKVSWSVSAIDSELYLQALVMVNDCDVCLDWKVLPDGGREQIVIDGSEDLTAQIMALDGGKALTWLHRLADDTPEPLTRHVSVLNERFGGVQTASQARDIAAAIDPRVLAIISQMALAVETDPPCAPSSRPPHRM